MNAAKPAKDTSDPKIWPVESATAAVALPQTQTTGQMQIVADSKPAEPKKGRKVRTLSAEVRAISHCEAILGKLTPEQAVRVANYILGISINRDRDRLKKEGFGFGPFTSIAGQQERNSLG